MMEAPKLYRFRSGPYRGLLLKVVAEDPNTGQITLQTYKGIHIVMTKAALAEDGEEVKQ